MWSKEVSIRTNASKEQIWKLWSDVSNWKSWDDQVTESSIDGKFIKGTKGKLVPKEGPNSTFQLIEVTELKSFTSRAKLPLGKMDFVHLIDESNGELIITHRIEISGLLTFLFSRLIGEKLIKEIPEAMDNLDKLAKELSNE